MSHCLSWSLCKLSDDDSSELVILSLTVLPSWPGDVVIPMLPSGTLLLTILVLSRRRLPGAYAHLSRFWLAALLFALCC